MTVKISKPAINVREELADLKKPTGIAGEAMLRAETPQEQFNLIGAGRRNLIINGAMQVAQRGTSFTSDGYTVDRFRVANGSVGNLTTTQESTNGPSGVSKYSMKVTATNTASLSAGSDGWIRYIIEKKDIENLTLSDTTKHFTVSFYVKCSNTGQSSIGVTSGNFSSAQYVYPFTISNADTWQKVSVAIPCSSLLSNVNGDYGLRLYWDIGAGTNYQTSSTNQWVTGGVYAASGNLQITGVNGRYLQITGVQLELGKVATPFEHRSYGEELALCQRYYEVFHAGSQTGYLAIGTWWTGDQARCVLQYTEKRANPSISASDVICYQNGSGTEYSLNESIDDAHSTHALLYGGVSGASTTAGHSLQMRVGSAGSVQIDAEL